MIQDSIGLYIYIYIKHLLLLRGQGLFMPHVSSFAAPHLD